MTRRLRVPLAVVAALGLVGAVAFVRLFVRPASDAPGRADAVVVLSGSPRRLQVALELMSAGTAPVLAVSNGHHSALAHELELCAGGHPWEVRCFRPPRQSTAGEARAIARMAADGAWGRVVVVTSTYHVTRARRLVSQCYHGELAVVDAGVAESSTGRVLRTLREPVALLAGATVDRACR